MKTEERISNAADYLLEENKWLRKENEWFRTESEQIRKQLVNAHEENFHIRTQVQRSAFEMFKERFECRIAPTSAGGFKCVACGSTLCD